ncbi:chemotaxis protein CheW [Duganella sp. FT50W]|uniref:Chemotaxis protein CheW n=1 Tax=Duganella lactea TaxID=2692173 RepID=A0A6L8MRK2_9BURK|nr:chemotaxis protein CheW [Duganella lactea]MYM84667.1 chemotaxis protein CheW [Duganella lactea]
MSTTTSPVAADVVDVQDCWNVIGVNGDQRCDKLAQAVHCRNCGVYASAAQKNLQRPVGADYKREWAAHFRQAAGDTRQLDASCLVFRVGREWLSLPTRMFVSVAPTAKPHRLPHRGSRGLSGIVNVGGTLYPCMSLAELLGIDDSEGEAATDRHTFARLLLTQWEDQAYALPVADLHGILRHASNQMQTPAATINKGLSRFLAGVITHGDMRIGALDETLIGHQLARSLR